MKTPAVLAISSGLLLFASFPSPDLGWLAWVALVPLLWAIRAASVRQAFALGYLAGAVAFAGIFSWIRIYGLPAWILLSAYMALWTGAFAGLYRWLSVGRSAAVGLWTVPLLWTSLEYLRSIGPLGFPWALLGVTQHATVPVMQSARVAGVFGVSFVLALGNAAFASVLSTRRLRVAIAAAAVVAAAVGWGAQQAQRDFPRALVAAALQSDDSPREKFDPALASEQMVSLKRLVETAGRESARLVVFPETAVPVDVFGPRGALDDLGRWARRARATLIAGSLEGGVSNIAVAVAPSGQAVDRYDKVRLVAFGEAGIRPGARHTPLWTPEGRVGVAICFESIFPQVARDLVRGGAEVLAVITNDGVLAGPSRFGRAAGPAQHAAHAPLRAVESGRWVIRAANAGVSMIIDPTGRVRASSPAGKVTALVDRVALSQRLTPYARWGDVFAGAVLVALGVLSLPRVVPAVRRDWRSPAFHLAAAAVFLPLIATWTLLAAGAPVWVWAGVLLVFALIFRAIRPPAAWRIRGRGFAPAIAGGLMVVAAAWAVMAAAFRAQGIPVELSAPAGGWIAGAFSQLLAAAALEVWLRGLAFTALAAWAGRPVALAVTTGLGMLVQTGLPAEAMAWALVSGGAFGLIRAWTGSTAGLIIPHAVGNILAAAVFAVR